MIYDGCIGIHECMTIDGFADWLIDQSDDIASLPLVDLLQMFRLSRPED